MDICNQINEISFELRMETILTFSFIEIRTDYHNRDFALRLDLKERLSGTIKLMPFDTFPQVVCLRWIT